MPSRRKPLLKIASCPCFQLAACRLGLAFDRSDNQTSGTQGMPISITELTSDSSMLGKLAESVAEMNM